MGVGKWGLGGSVKPPIYKQYCPGPCIMHSVDAVA